MVGTGQEIVRGKGKYMGNLTSNQGKFKSLKEVSEK